MNALTKRTLIIAAACAVSGVVWLTLAHSPPEDHPGKIPALPAPQSSRIPSPNSKLPRASKAEGNALALAELKARWGSLGESPVGRGEEIALLIRESITRLGCSGELVGLLKFIESSPEFMAATLNFQERVDTVMEELFLTSAGLRMREGLLALEDRSFRQRWAYAAAQGCTPADYPAFAAALGEEDCRSFAAWGYYQGLVKTDPAGALTGLLALLKQDKSARVTSAYASTALAKLTAALPPTAAFAELEKQLPPAESPRGWDSARDALLARWGETDPAGAAAHVMAHPDRIPASSMQAVVGSFLNSRPAEAIEWLQDLPPGPHQDAAILAALSTLRGKFNGAYVAEALELAGQISDPALKKSEIRRLQTPRVPTR